MTRTVIDFKPPEQLRDDRVEMPIELRQVATSLESACRRTTGKVGTNWSTARSIRSATDDLVWIAERALTLRRLCEAYLAKLENQD